MIADERHGGTEPRRAIDYRYSDRIEEEEEEAVGAGRTIEEGVNRPSVIPPGQPGHVHQAAVENEWARE